MIWRPRRQDDVVYLIKKTRRVTGSFFGLRADTASAGSEPKRLAAAVLLINSHRTYAATETYCNVQGLPGQPPHSSAHAAVVHIIGNFFAYVRQFEEFLFSQGIFLFFASSRYLAASSRK